MKFKYKYVLSTMSTKAPTTMTPACRVSVYMTAVRPPVNVVIYSFY